MSEPYLILHKVRGEPAFDVAIKVQVGAEDETQPGWIGEWWIIPTSGHRAYPMYQIPLASLDVVYEGGTFNFVKDAMSVWSPDGFPDHYAINDAPKPKSSSPRVQSTTDDFLV